MVQQGGASNIPVAKSTRHFEASSVSRPRVLLVALLAACFQQVASVITLCVDKNPFIKNLAAKGVTVFSTPAVASSTTCFKEWSPHKTCCLASSLVAYAANETQQMNSAVQGVSSELIALGNALNSFLTPVSSVWSTLNTSTANQTFQTDLGKLRAFTNSLVTLAPADNLAQSQCSSRVQYLKGQSLCAACSGRSEALFSSQRLRITLQDCKKTVGACAYSWNRMVALVDHMVLAESIVKTLKYLFPKFLHTIDMNKVAPLEAWIETKQVKVSIKNCVNSTSPTCDLTSSKNLCENFISLQKKSFSEAALNLVSDELPSLNAVKTTTISIKVALETQPATLSEANNLVFTAGSKLYISPAISVTDVASMQQVASLGTTNLATVSTATIDTIQPLSPQTNWSLMRRRLQFSSDGTQTDSAMTTPCDGMGGDTQCDSADKPEDCQGCMSTDCQFP